MKKILPYLKIFLILIASFFIFSVLSCLLQGERIHQNIKESLPQLLEEGNYPEVIFRGDNYKQDNFTDAVILNIIVSTDSKHPMRAGLMNYFSFQSPETERWYAIQHLAYKVENPDLEPNLSYNRYWFGSASVYRVLLLGISYQQIKMFLYIASTLLLLLFAVNIVKKVGWIKSLPLFLALLFADFFITQFSMLFFSAMAIALIGGIWICRNGGQSLSKITMFFFITGIFTAYFDLLTIPLITLGLPLIVFMILQGEERKSMWEILKSIVILCMFWLIGYGSAWAAKWALTIILAEPAALNGVIETIKMRTSTDECTRWDSIVRNFNLLPLSGLIVICTFLLLVTLLSFNKKGVPLAILFLIVGLMPYGWYWILSDHSYLHAWFTYRAQIISMSCGMLCFVSLIDWERLKLKLKIKNKNY